MKRKVVQGSLVLCALLLLAGSLLAGCAPSDGDADVYKVRLSSQMPVDHHITEALDLFCERAEELSDGQLEFHHYPAGQLLTDAEVPEAIAGGTVEMAQTYLPWWEGIVPNLNLSGGVFLDDLEHYKRINAGPYGDYQAGLLKGNASCQVITSMLYTSEAGYILTQPVYEPGDADGMKIRTPSAAASADIQAMGGVPTVMSSADVYMALQRGTIEGALSGLTSFYARKWYEVAKNVLIWDVNITDFPLVASLDWWNGLPEDLQQAILDAGEEASAYAEDACLASEAAVETALDAEGVEIYRVPQEDRDEVWQPLVAPARHQAAVDEHGEELVSQYETWVEEAREQ